MNTYPWPIVNGCKLNKKQEIEPNILYGPGLDVHKFKKYTT